MGASRRKRGKTHGSTATAARMIIALSVVGFCLPIRSDRALAQVARGGADTDGESVPVTQVRKQQTAETHRASRADRERPEARADIGSPFRADGADTLIGIAMPSQEAVLASVLPARIAALPAAEGATVEQGDLVVALEDDVQRARVAFARAAAESTAAVDLARVRHEAASRDWDRVRRLDANRHVTPDEVDQARTALEIAQLEYEEATFNHQQAQRAYERERAVLEQYRLRAPFAGYVATHLKRPGEVVDQLEGIVRVVRLDPLEVRVDCPLAIGARVRAGQRAEVRPVNEQYRSKTGTVTLVGRVVDAASQTLRVHIEVPNEDGSWPGGLKVDVAFSPIVARQTSESPNVQKSK